MEKLIKNTTAYAMFSNDCRLGRLSHAYMLLFADAKNLRDALKIFALRFFGEDENSAEGKRLLSGATHDFKIYPEEGKKLSAEGVSALIADAALKPVGRDKKLYAVCGFEQASVLLQNKLLKTLEEPPEGVYFLLGATSSAPVLDTVKSRVRSLDIPPFTAEEIFAALERRGENPMNAEAAASCGGILGVAQDMADGGWFKDVVAAADKIFNSADIQTAAQSAAEYADTKYKNELLMRLQQKYRAALSDAAQGHDGRLCEGALIYALESLEKAAADVKFNANFQGLLFDFMLRVTEENDRWSRLRA